METPGAYSKFIGFSFSRKAIQNPPKIYQILPISKNGGAWYFFGTFQDFSF
jgi:hypothetical protein